VEKYGRKWDRMKGRSKERKKGKMYLLTKSVTLRKLNKKYDV
jgi:hypothetical protein